MLERRAVHGHVHQSSPHKAEMLLESAAEHLDFWSWGSGYGLGTEQVYQPLEQVVVNPPFACTLARSHMHYERYKSRLSAWEIINPAGPVLMGAAFCLSAAKHQLLLSGRQAGGWRALV